MTESRVLLVSQLQCHQKKSCCRCLVSLNSSISYTELPLLMIKFLSNLDCFKANRIVNFGHKPFLMRRMRTSFQN